ncbi:MAG: glycosyltransferase [Sphingobacterium sp.]|jgi:glycosyltransferase involved in cell wall biosynthesis|nr:glycosyltransferase [Sphingobacterium sp.]
MRPPVSVIVPVFNVKDFIEHNAHQLFKQDLEGVEYIFVDDCSPDNSIQLLESVLKEYPEKLATTTIIRHEHNRGLPSARNSGLDVATGEFIFHCDSDDWLEINALSQLYNKAKQDGSDAVWCDWYLTFKDNERYMSQAPKEVRLFTGFNVVKLMLGGRIRFNVWNKLVSRDLYEQHNIRFPDGYSMGEDMTMIKLVACAGHVSYLPMALYHYVQTNTEAFTKKTSEKHLQQIRHNVDHTILFLQGRYGNAVADDIQFFKLNIKLPFLISNDSDSYRRWLDWYPEANRYIPHNPMFNWRIRFIQYVAMKKQFWILKLYYYLIIRFIYGIVYK